MRLHNASIVKRPVKKMCLNERARGDTGIIVCNAHCYSLTIGVEILPET